MAASSIAKLSVLFTSDSSGFDKNIKKSLNKTSKQFANWSKLVVSAGAAVAGAMAKIVVDAAKVADSLAKTSRKLGMTTTELAGLRLAAELSGVGITQLDTGLQRIIRRTSEAAIGTGEAQAALIELGIAAEGFNKMSQSEKVFALADAFERVEGAGERVRLMMKLADTEGVGLVNMLAMGSKALRKMQSDAVRLGLAFENGAAAKFEDFNDALIMMQKQGTGLKNTIATEMLPMLQALNAELSELTLSERYKIFNRTISAMFLEVSASLESGISAFQFFRAELVGGMKTFIDANKGTIGVFIKGVEITINRAIEAVSELLKKATSKLKLFIIASNAAFGTSIKAPSFGGIDPITLPTVGEIGDAMDKGQKDLMESALDYQRRSLLSKKMADEARAEIEKIKADALAAGAITTNFGKDAIEGLGETSEAASRGAGKAADEVIENMEKAAEAARRAAEEMRRPWLNALSDMGSGLGDLITTGKTQWENFGDFFKSITLKMVADYLVAWAEGMVKRIAMEMAVTGTKSSIGWVSAVAGAFTGPQSSYFGSGNLTGLATGGSASGGVPYLVGERGPEIMVPGSSGQVMPNHKIGGGGGGNPINITQNFSTGVSESQLFEATRATFEAAKAGVVDAVTRGGSYRRAMQY